MIRNELLFCTIIEEEISIIDKEERLKAFAAEMKAGYQLVKEKRNDEAVKKLKPFITLMKQSDAPHIRLFVSYSIAQLRTGDVDGFLVTYGDIKEMKAKNKEDILLKQQVDELFEELMEQFQNGEG